MPTMVCGLMVTVHGLHYTAGLYFDGALHPREWSGLWRIFTFPFLHGNWSHLLSNLPPLFLLSTALFGLYTSLSARVVTGIYLMSGLLTWAMGEQGSRHVGASGLVYGLAAFLFLSGLLRRYRPLMGLSLLISFLYGGMIWGVLPQGGNVSWEGHLSGAISGIVLALYYRRDGPQPPTPTDFEEKSLPEDITYDDLHHYWLKVPATWPPEYASNQDTSTSKPPLRVIYHYRLDRNGG